MKFRLLFIACSLVFLCKNTYAQQIDVLSTGHIRSIRGLSVVDNNILWVSGTGGTVGKSVNGGKDWEWIQVPGCDSLDWRDIEAFSAQKAMVVNAGSPANIYLTEDGGKNWTRTYFNDEKEVFLDALDFVDAKNGAIIGDPLNNQLFVLQTHDGGKSWDKVVYNDNGAMQEGEAYFAASGTCLRAIPGSSSYYIVSGGKASHLYKIKGASLYSKSALPIIHGESSQGPFSTAFLNEKTGVIIGGDYMKDTLSTKNCFLTNDGGLTWTAPTQSPFGYKSAVEYVNNKTLVATGTSGTDVSFDGGRNWKNISRERFNCVRKAKKGNNIYLAGDRGKIAILSLPK
ncbi:photosystem II stability/assembly factor-like uncharacterized protein [Chitinophaga skermanii]|uniref:Photosystem II stability/assembly factor-like uncharacterized protein n=1 Tax=Chitinophaga skermanii TaxID=331697 RepID=A0A327QTT7_9BACT|nr:YCF48-related protein [Chitinophaga skermanii]RAJ06813.1 photosystem II stability/assembly factor-like uncharacterized protein [Chitinophaga skermanii]